MTNRIAIFQPLDLAITVKFVYCGFCHSCDILTVPKSIRRRVPMEGFIQKGNIFSHESGQFRIRERKGRCLEVEFLSRPGLWISSGTRDVHEAEKFAIEKLAKGGRLINSKGMKLSDFGDAFFGTVESSILRTKNERFHKFISANRYEELIGVYKNYIRPALGDIDPTKISDVMIEDWYLSIVSVRSSESLCSSYKLTVLEALNQLMKELKRQGVIEANPCDTVERLRVDDKVPREAFLLEEVQKMFPPEREELLKIWRNLKWALYFSIMADTGWRPGEVMGISTNSIIPPNALYQTENVDPKTRRIKPSIKTTHSGKKHKVGVLSSYTMELLDDYLKTTDKEYLFQNPFDDTFPGDAFANRVLDEAMRNAGVPKNSPVTGRPRTQYGFRHFFSTYMHDHRGENGLMEEDISELMAHMGYRSEYDHRTAQMLAFRMSAKASDVINGIRADKKEESTTVKPHSPDCENMVG